MTGAAAQVSGSPCEAPAAVAACPVIRGIGVIVRTIARSHRCTNSLHEFFVQASLRAPSKCGRRGAWATRSAGDSCLPASAPATCLAVSGGGAAVGKVPTLIDRVTLILCRPQKPWTFPPRRLPCASFWRLKLSLFELNSDQLEPFGRSAGRLRNFRLCFLI